MNFQEEYKNRPLVLPQAMLMHFAAVFETADAFLMWTFCYSNPQIAPSEIAESVGMTVAEVNGAISRLTAQGLLKIELFGNEMSYDASPAFAKLDQLLENDDVENTEIMSKVSGGALQALVADFEAEMGMMSPIQMEEIRSWLEKDKYDAALIREALREAVLNRKVNLNYIRAILRNWAQDGVKTAADVADKRLEREEAMAPSETGESFFIPIDGPWNAEQK
ncbi:MAG: DnaD domain-containing protein [Streptococcaceae bacterium]|jgi:DNA replication protein|nr:DnaD domain-containing protein [Streptococcaceae bacterium]